MVCVPEATQKFALLFFSLMQVMSAKILLNSLGSNTECMYLFQTQKKNENVLSPVRPQKISGIMAVLPAK